MQKTLKFEQWFNDVKENDVIVFNDLETHNPYKITAKTVFGRVVRKNIQSVLVHLFDAQNEKKSKMIFGFKSAKIVGRDM